MSKWYGSVINRLEENKNYTGRKDIQVGDDITMYHWSDRTCYYVDQVIDQKHIIVKPYHICADHSKAGGMGHQDWLYFKTLKEHNAYLNGLHLTVDGNEIHYEEDPKESERQEWIYRYNNWYEVFRTSYGKPLAKPIYQKVGNVSFGVRDYYYDWEF